MDEIEKELQGFVKLHKWEDRGYFAMKTAGERAQRKLHRLCKKAEDVLKQPAASAFAQVSQSAGYVALSNAHDENSPSTVVVYQQDSPLRPLTCDSLMEELRNVAEEVSKNDMSMTELLRLEHRELRFNQLPRLLSRMHELSLHSPVLDKLEKARDHLEAISHGILDRIQELQKDKSKGSRGRKKKALSDYLKTLYGLEISRRRSDIPKGDMFLVANGALS